MVPPDSRRAEAPPRLVYPEPLTPKEAAEIEQVLPDRSTEAILAWISGDGPDPWLEPSA